MKANAKCLLGALALLLIVPTVALAAPNLPIAEVENLGDTLVFHPFVEYATLVLTVTGPCDFQYKQRFTKEEPYFRLDQTTIDGVYRYNLMREETIDPSIVDMLREARQNNDEETPRALCRAGKLPGPPESQSEGFRVFRGELVYDPGAIEKAAGPNGDTDGAAGGHGNVVPTKDFVINDDLIVDGSACIGFDCVNGESFGFDTLRLKENNLRIKFDDTSTAASFPRNDWQLTANDSANGGASKFSIDDISGSRTPFTVEANARSHSLYVDDGGRIGSRTSTPSTEIHTIDGDTPTLRLQQDGSSGFAPQTWDVAGNETNFFIRDVTNGSQLPLRIRPDAPTSSIFIDVDGDVGMGTSSPGAPLHVVDSAGADANVLELENNGGVRIQLTNTATPTASTNDWLFSAVNAGFRITRESSGGLEFEIDNDGNTTLRGDLTVCNDTSICTPTTSYPDYVFEDDYALMPLDELASFIGENKHLPSVPTLDDISQGGVNMTKLQWKLLEKVEELTLYTLSQHGTIQEQQKTIQELQERLAALEQEQ